MRNLEKLTSEKNGSDEQKRKTPTLSFGFKLDGFESCLPSPFACSVIYSQKYIETGLVDRCSRSFLVLVLLCGTYCGYNKTMVRLTSWLASSFSTSISCFRSFSFFLAFFRVLRFRIFRFSMFFSSRSSSFRLFMVS